MTAIDQLVRQFFTLYADTFYLFIGCRYGASAMAAMGMWSEDPTAVIYLTVGYVMI